MSKASDIGIINVIPCVRLLEKVKNQVNMKARIQEDKCLDKIIKETTMYMQNLEPLDLPDVRVSVGVDVGLNIGFHVGAVIGVGVATGYDLGSGENSVVNILQPLINKTCYRVKEYLYSVGGDSDILVSISGGTITNGMNYVRLKSRGALKPIIRLND